MTHCQYWSNYQAPFTFLSPRNTSCTQLEIQDQEENKPDTTVRQVYAKSQAQQILLSP